MDAVSLYCWWTLSTLMMTHRRFHLPFVFPSEIWWLVSTYTNMPATYLYPFPPAEDCWEVFQLQHWNSHFQSGPQPVLFLYNNFIYFNYAACLHDKQCQLIYLHSLLQSQYPRIVTEDFSPLPSKGKAGKEGWLVSFLSYYKSQYSSIDHPNEISPCFMHNLSWRLWILCEPYAIYSLSA